MLHVLHIVAALPEEGGGLATFVVQLATAEAAHGHDVSIATLSPHPLPPMARLAEKHGVRVVAFRPSRPRAVYFSWTMLRGLRRIVRGADVVHVHCDWTFPVWWGCHCALAESKPLAMSPHGSFDPVRLAHSAWKKSLVGWLDRRYLRRADFVHTTSESESGWMRTLLGESSRIVAVPPGVSPPPGDVPPPGGRSTRNLLCLGRLHPLKGIDLLLEGIARIAPAGRQALRLLVCGPDEGGERKRLEVLAEKLGIGGCVEFRGAVPPGKVGELLAACDALVLPSRSENFGIVVAESLAAGRPAIGTKATPWDVLEREHCGWWCETSAEGLQGAVEGFLATSDPELREMGRRGRAYAADHLRWEKTAAVLLGAYERARGRKESP